MGLTDLLNETLDVDCEEVWANERTPTPVKVVRVSLHSMGLSLREVVTALEFLGVDRLHGTIWSWMYTVVDAQSEPPTAASSWVAVDEEQIKVDGENKWLYAVIGTDSKLLLEIDVFRRRGIDPAAVFLHRLTEKHDVSDAEFLVDAGGYLSVLARREFSSQLDYRERNDIEKWFGPSPCGSTASIRYDEGVRRALALAAAV